MEEKIVLYKFLEGIKDNFLFIFEEHSKEIDVIIAVHKIQNKDLKIILTSNLDYPELNKLLVQSNVLIINNDKKNILIDHIEVPVFYYENTLKTFSVKDNNLSQLDLLIEKAIEENKKVKTVDIFDEKNILNTLGLRIKRIRTNNNYTQEEFSDLLGVSSNFLSDVERGKKSLSIEKILFLCKTLNVDLNDLFLNVELKETDGILLGENNGKKVILSDNDRKLHTLILGQTGCGKTRLMKKYIKEDIKKDCPVVVIEPKGDLIDSLIENERKSDTIYFDPLYGSYYLDIFKNEISFLMELFADTFEINSYKDNNLIKFLLNKTLEIMKKSNMNSSDYFIFILNQEISNYKGLQDDLKIFFNNINSFFQDKFVKTSFNVDSSKKELDFKKALIDNKVILISTRAGNLRNLHKTYSSLILNCYMKSIEFKKENNSFQPLYIDEIQCYDKSINKFILYARTLNIGITMSSQNLDMVNKTILSNTKNFIIYNYYLNIKDNNYLSSIFNFNIEKNNNYCFYHIIKDLSVIENGYFEIIK